MMSSWVLLAQTPYQNRLKGLRGAFDNKKSDPADIALILIFMAVLVALLIVILVARKIHRRMSGSTDPGFPAKLFNRVMKTMGLGLIDRVIMKMIARASHLSQPTILFFSPELFDQYTQHATDSVTFTMLHEHLRHRIDAVRGLAFVPVVVSESTADNSTDP